VKLAMLQPRVQTLRARPIAPLAATLRLRGSSWMVIRDRILRRDNGICQCTECKRLGRLRAAHEVDHIVELADGGTDADCNLQAINHDCHVEKTDASRKARGQTR
jgi:5-methylcytosine-specific restriction endonuclease McrA